MKMPQSPPDYKALICSEPQLFERIVPLLAKPPAEYLHWDKLRHLSPPDDFTAEEWWTAVKIGRLHQEKPIPLLDLKGQAFTYLVPDSTAEKLHQFDMGAGGRIGMLEPVTNPQVRDQYLVSSLIHEAITSSQLEGAVTTRAVAKEMLRSGRPPRDKSERMILNNFLTMRQILDLRDQELTPELVFRIHRQVTQGTLDHGDAAGRLRHEGETVTVEDESGEIFHIPPPAVKLPERLRQMCDFANGRSPGHFIHPAIRAIMLHFWLAYDHPFVDGHGRTARALFYWAMLRHGYWLFEFISISDILNRSPSAYYRAFLYTETDGNDLTYFLVHQVEVISRAIENLHAYIQRKTTQLRECEALLRGWDQLNHRQVALITHALKHPGGTYTVEGHQQSHATAYDTARTDLLKLVTHGLLECVRRGKKMLYHAPNDLYQRITSPPP